jgi:hypothetical protein
MKALSMMQPYAWLFAHGYLAIDDRLWPTSHCGLLALHASKGFQDKYYEFLLEHTGWPMPAASEFNQGGIVGVAILTDCIAPTAPRGAPMHRLELRRAHLGAPGHYGFVLEEARPVAFVPFRGNRGVFDIPEEILAGR